MRGTVPAYQVFPVLEAPEDPGHCILEARECFRHSSDGTEPSLYEPATPERGLFVVLGMTNQNGCKRAVHEDKPPILFSGEAAAYANALPSYFHAPRRVLSLGAGFIHLCWACVVASLHWDGYFGLGNLERSTSSLPDLVQLVL